MIGYSLRGRGLSRGSKRDERAVARAVAEGLEGRVMLAGQVRVLDAIHNGDDGASLVYPNPAASEDGSLVYVASHDSGMVNAYRRTDDGLEMIGSPFSSHVGSGLVQPLIYTDSTGMHLFQGSYWGGAMAVCDIGENGLPKDDTWQTFGGYFSVCTLKIRQSPDQSRTVVYALMADARTMRVLEFKHVGTGHSLEEIQSFALPLTVTYGLALYDDGTCRNAYVTGRATDAGSSGLAVYKIKDDGLLEALGEPLLNGPGIEGLGGAMNVAVSPDGEVVFVSSQSGVGWSENRLVAYKRNKADGSVDPNNFRVLVGDDGDPTGLHGFSLIHMTPTMDNPRLFGVSGIDGAVGIFEYVPNAGSLDCLRVVKVLRDGVDGQFAWPGSTYLSVTDSAQTFYVGSWTHSSVTPIEVEYEPAGGTIHVDIRDQNGDEIKYFRLGPGSDKSDTIVERIAADSDPMYRTPTLADFDADGNYEPAHRDVQGEIFVQVVRQRDGEIVANRAYGPGLPIEIDVAEPGAYRVRCATRVQIDEAVQVDYSMPTGADQPAPDWTEDPRKKPQSQVDTDDPTKGPYELAKVFWSRSEFLERGWYTYLKRYTYKVVSDTETYVSPGETDDRAFVCLPVGSTEIYEILEKAEARQQGNPLNAESLTAKAGVQAFKAGVNLLLEKKFGDLVAAVGSGVTDAAGTLIGCLGRPHEDLSESALKVGTSAMVGVAVGSIGGWPGAVVGFGVGFLVDWLIAEYDREQLRTVTEEATEDDLVYQFEDDGDSLRLFNQGAKLKNVRVQGVPVSKEAEEELAALESRRRVGEMRLNLMPGHCVVFHGIDALVRPGMNHDPNGDAIPFKLQIAFDRALAPGLGMLKDCELDVDGLSVLVADESRPGIMESSDVVNSGRKSRNGVARLDFRFNEYLRDFLPMSALSLYRNGSEKIEIENAVLIQEATDTVSLQFKTFLRDGNYELRVNPVGVLDWGGNFADGGAKGYLSIPFHVLQGDVDGNGEVNSSDRAACAAALNTTVWMLGFDFDADVNLDLKVDQADLDIIDGKIGVSLENLTVPGGGTCEINGYRDLNQLVVEDGGKMVLGDGAELAVNTLSMGNGATFDVNNGTVTVRPDADARDAVLRRLFAALQTGRAGGMWTGNGMASTAAKNDASGFSGLGMRIDDQGDVVVKYTWNGDANIDGVVDADDYFLADSGYITQAGGWCNGDFNYDGRMDSDDYFLIDSAFIGQAGVLGVQEVEDVIVQELGGGRDQVAKSWKVDEEEGVVAGLFSEVAIY